MKRMIAWLAILVLVGGAAWAAPKSVDERVADELAIYSEALALSDEQAAALREGLTRKITIGHEAQGIKQGGDKARAARRVTLTPSERPFARIRRRADAESRQLTYNDILPVSRGRYFTPGR